MHYMHYHCHYQHYISLLVILCTALLMTIIMAYYTYSIVNTLYYGSANPIIGMISPHVTNTAMATLLTPWHVHSTTVNNMLWCFHQHWLPSIITLAILLCSGYFLLLSSFSPAISENTNVLNTNSCIKCHSVLYKNKTSHTFWRVAATASNTYTLIW